MKEIYKVSMAPVYMAVNGRKGRRFLTRRAAIYDYCVGRVWNKYIAGYSEEDDRGELYILAGRYAKWVHRCLRKAK